MNDEDHSRAGSRIVNRPPWMTGSLIGLVFIGYLLALLYAAQRWELPRIGLRGAGLLLVAAAFELTAKWVFAELFRVGAATVGHPISKSGSIKAALAGSAVARLVPAGGTLTPTTMAWSVRTENDQLAGAALRVTLLTYGGLLTMTGGAVLWGTSSGRHPLLFAGQLTLGVALVLVGLGILGASPWLAQVINRLPGFLRRHFAATADGGRLSFREAVLVFLRISAEAGVLWGALYAVGIHLTPTETMVIYGVSAIVGGVPSLPGGLLLVEGGLIGLLTAYGFSMSAVVAPVLIYRIVDYWMPAGVGLATWAMIANERAKTDD